MYVKNRILVLLLLVSAVLTVFACTTIGVTKGASVDGSTMVTHTCDCGMCDFRIIRTPAMDHPVGSMRPVYVYMDQYPAYVGLDRGPGWNTPGYEPTKPLGYIPQVPHTYAYFGSSYGIMNEHQLAIGECTTGAKIYAMEKENECIFDISALSRVALERCKGAEEAVLLMGELGQKYGYYGWGETLVVADTEEVWVIEMCGTPDGKSALWAAQRVPDGEVFVEANHFRIRDLEEKGQKFHYSSNLKEVAQKEGWWAPGQPLDWTKIVGSGEYGNAYYSHRRVWRTLDRLAPSLGLSPWVEDTYTTAYPFSVKPEKKLTVADVIDLQRDWYQGTEFDLSKGLAAGPFGNINRYAGSSKLVKGGWERAISVFRCAYVFVSQSRGWLPDPIGGLLWFGPDAPHTSAYVPFYCGMTELPRVYEIGDLHTYDYESAGWTFNLMGNWMDLKFSYMIKDVQAKQHEIEDREFAFQPAIEDAAKQLYLVSPELAVDFITDYAVNNANRVVQEWKRFTEKMFAKYIDGYVDGNSVGYPDWWLQKVEFVTGQLAGQYAPNK
ncbi:MAG: iron ABC transporter ATP-binding protein [Thermotogaceae bacterium]|jgi:dipeptidase|nr:C69 family dipeptidase [Thermotogota bacterium]NLH18832.1 iron ABC transporter ATP-binding protein [Thermotogaceae bacterium]